MTNPQNQNAYLGYFIKHRDSLYKNFPFFATERDPNRKEECGLQIISPVHLTELPQIRGINGIKVSEIGFREGHQPTKKERDFLHAELYQDRIWFSEHHYQFVKDGIAHNGRIIGDILGSATGKIGAWDEWNSARDKWHIVDALAISSIQDAHNRYVLYTAEKEKVGAFRCHVHGEFASRSNEEAIPEGYINTRLLFNAVGDEVTREEYFADSPTPYRTETYYLRISHKLDR